MLDVSAGDLRRPAGGVYEFANTGGILDLSPMGQMISNALHIGAREASASMALANSCGPCTVFPRPRLPIWVENSTVRHSVLSVFFSRRPAEMTWVNAAVAPHAARVGRLKPR